MMDIRLGRFRGLVAVGAAAWGVLNPGVGLGAEEGDVTGQLEALRAEVAGLRAVNREVGALRAQVADLKGRANDSWLTERRAEEVKGLIREVLADADQRASLLAEGMTAGHNGKHFFLESADGAFSMEIAGQIQLRYVMGFREHSSDDLESGFELRRTKMEFSGHIADPKLTYAVQLTVNRSDNVMVADKIVIGYQVADGFEIWAGEDKAVFLREEMISSKRQLAVERSVFNEEFTLDKVQGVGAVIDAGGVAKFHVMVNDGMRSGDGGTEPAPFTQTSPFNGDEDDRATSKRFDRDDVDIAFTGRAEVKLAGDWKQMKDFTSWPGEELAVFLGAAIHYEVGETGDSLANNNLLTWTVDGSVEVGGFNVFAAVAGHHTDLEMETATVTDVDLIGFLVQGGYNFAVGEGSLEPFIRFEWIDFDGVYGTSGTGREEEVSFLTVGSNFYFKKHDAKLTLDVVWALDHVPNGHSGLGISTDASGEEGQVVLRSQFQLVY